MATTSIIRPVRFTHGGAPLRRSSEAARLLLHVLVLNEYFPPDTSATAKNAALVVDALAERHRVTVLAGRPSYDPTERHPPYLLRREVRGNLMVERVGSTAFPRFRMKGRVSQLPDAISRWPSRGR